MLSMKTKITLSLGFLLSITSFGTSLTAPKQPTTKFNQFLVENVAQRFLLVAQWPFLSEKKKGLAIKEMKNKREDERKRLDVESQAYRATVKASSKLIKQREWEERNEELQKLPSSVLEKLKKDKEDAKKNSKLPEAIKNIKKAIHELKSGWDLHNGKCKEQEENRRRLLKNFGKAKHEFVRTEACLESRLEELEEQVLLEREIIGEELREDDLQRPSDTWSYMLHRLYGEFN